MMKFIKNIYADSRFLTAVRIFIITVFGIVLEHVVKVIDNIGPAVETVPGV